MAKKKTKHIVIWSEVWDDFNAWYESHEKRCESCGTLAGKPEWDEQMCEIEEIVEKQLSSRR